MSKDGGLMLMADGCLGPGWLVGWMTDRDADSRLDNSWSILATAQDVGSLILRGIEGRQIGVVATTTYKY